MNYQEFTYGVGEIVLTLQIIEDNLRLLLKSEQKGLSALNAELLKSEKKDLFQPETLAAIGKLELVQDYYTHRACLSFIDEENLDASIPFHDACKKLTEDREALTHINGIIAHLVLPPHSH